MYLKANKTYLKITGKFVRIIDEKYVLDYGSIYIENGVIVAINSKYTPVVDEEQDRDLDVNYRTIELDEQKVLFPGMIDLHTHYQYNMLPLWDRPQATPWDNRFEWRNNSQYKHDIEEVYSFIKENWNRPLSTGTVGDLFLFFSEIQAVAGGCTVLQEPSEIYLSDDENSARLTYSIFNSNDSKVKRSHLLIRSTGRTDDLGIDTSNEKSILSITDFFMPNEVEQDIKPNIDTSTWTIQEKSSFQEFCSYLSNPTNDYRGYLVHMGEGRSGNLCPGGLGVDAYSKLEFETLKEKIEEICIGDKKQNLEKISLGLIHGCGIDMNNLDNYKFLVDNKIGLIWSPVSNLLLYDDTPSFYEIDTNNENKLIVAIGSDWSPSGSKQVADEGRFAYKFITKGKIDFEVMQDVHKMITTKPAKMLKADKVGKIEVGAFADFLVMYIRDLKCDFSNIQSVMEYFYSASDSSTDMVMVGGNVIFGHIKYFQDAGIRTYQQLPSDDQHQFGGVCVYVPEELNIDVMKDTKFLDKLLATKGFKRSHFMSFRDDAYNERIKQLSEKFCK